MLAIISPAKNMKRYLGEEQIVQKKDNYNKPDFMDKTVLLWEQLKNYNPWELEELLKVNEQLAAQAFMDFQDFVPDRDGQEALLSYDGLVFKNIEADKFSVEELEFAENHLRILSAFYGVLKPMHHIKPYRLEMQCKIKVDGKSLYHFWQDDFYKQLYMEDEIILNLASEEYAKSIRKHLKDYDKFIDVEFYVMRQGKLKTLATWAKMARGQMVRHMVTNRIKTPDQIKEFSWNGYRFEPSLSYDNKYVFLME